MRRQRISNAHAHARENPGAPFVLPASASISPADQAKDSAHASTFSRWATTAVLFPLVLLASGVATIFVLKFLELLWKAL